MNEVEALQVFDGVVLSDGCIAKPNQHGEAYFALNLSGAVHLDWMNHVADAMALLGVDVSELGSPKVLSNKGKIKEYCRFYTRASTFLTEQHGRWYQDGKR